MAWPGRNGGGVPPGFPGGASRPAEPSWKGARWRPQPPERPAHPDRPVRIIRPARPARPEPDRSDHLDADEARPAGKPNRAASAGDLERGDEIDRDDGAGGPDRSDRPGRDPRQRRLRHAGQASVVRLQTRWPGQGGTGVPPGFPGFAGSDPDGGGTGGTGDIDGDEPKTVVITTNPLFRRSAAEQAAEEAAENLAAGRGRGGGVRRVAGLAPRGFTNVVGAVYSALSDPLVNASPETRARRGAQVRRAGTVAASAGVCAVLVYGIFPVRTYLDQRSASQRTKEELDVLTEANDRMTQQVEQLQQEQTVEEIARRDYGMVFPGEEPYAVLPAPTEDTTTSTTTPDP